MPYTAQDELFTHQLPRTFDQVADSDPSFSDRCYFNCHSPSGDLLIVTGYGNNPNSQNAHGYFKVALADGRHWDLDAVRPVIDDRGDNFAGPMRWTCVEPLKHWRLEVAPNSSGIECELNWHARTPLWELKPIVLRRDGRVMADFQHIKQSATYTGWIKIDDETISVDGFNGGRDRTIGVRVSEKIDFWIWYSAELGNRSIEAWLWETSDAIAEYVDGGFCHEDGSLSAPFIRLDHEVDFDGDLKRPLAARLKFVDVEGQEFEVSARAEHPEVIVYYGSSTLPNQQDAGGLSWKAWDSTDGEQLRAVEVGSVALDQLMRHELDGEAGYGIFEFLVRGKGYDRYPNLAPAELKAAVTG